MQASSRLRLVVCTVGRNASTDLFVWLTRRPRWLLVFDIAFCAVETNST